MKPAERTFVQESPGKMEFYYRGVYWSEVMLADVIDALLSEQDHLDGVRYYRAIARDKPRRNA